MASKDDGKPLIPLTAAMTPEQLEYARQCLDYLLWGGKPSFELSEVEKISEETTITPVGDIIGFLKEFAEQKYSTQEAL